MNYNIIMQKARRTNALRDQEDSNGKRGYFEREFGFSFQELSKGVKTPFLTGPVSDAPLDEQLRTAMSAISCGISCEDWNAIAEGQAMLEDVHKQMTGKPYRG